MIRRNGKPRPSQMPPAIVARDLRAAVGDLLSLAELQLQLLKADVRDGSRRIIWSVIFLVITGIFALASFPVGLLALAWGMTDWFDMSMALACLISFAIGLVFAAACSFIAFRSIRRSVKIFDRSRTELANNIRWLKQVVGAGDDEDAMQAAPGEREMESMP
jgi:hypothetical protein